MSYLYLVRIATAVLYVAAAPSRRILGVGVGVEADLIRDREVDDRRGDPTCATVESGWPS